MDQHKWVKISIACMILGLAICFLAFALGGFNIHNVLTNDGRHEWYRLVITTDFG